MKFCFSKYFLYAVIFFICYNSKAQIIKFDHGTIEFYTGTVVSDIEAVSEKADVSLIIETGEVSVAIDIESFEFEYELMQEHFNKKYMESGKFPQVTLKGKISQDISKSIESEMVVDIVGILTIHGVTKDIQFKANLSKQGEFTVVKAKIPVVFKDFDVDDPTILTKSVANEIEVKATFYLK